MKDLIDRTELLKKIKEAQDSLMSDDDKTWERNKKYYKGLAWAYRLTLEARREDPERKKGANNSQSMVKD